MLGNPYPQIEELDLSGLSGISDEGLLALLQNSKRSLVKKRLSQRKNRRHLKDGSHVLKVIPRHVLVKEPWLNEENDRI